MPNILSEIQLWKADRSAQISLPDGNGIHNYMESDAEVKRLLGDVDTLTLTLTPGSKLATATSDDAYELTQGKIVRFVYDDGSIEEWRIKSKSREFSGEKNPKVRCEPIVQDLKTYTVRKTLANGHARASVSFYNQSFTDIITNLLSSEYNCPDLFTVGSIASGLNDQTYNLVLNASYIMEGLKKICQLAEAEWGVSYNANNDNYEINFYESGGLGGGESEAADRPIAMGGGKGNRLTLEKRDETEEYFSRVVPLMGEGSEIQTVGDAKWNVDTVNYNSTAGESTVTLEEPAIVKDGYGLIDGKTIYFGNETEGWQEVLSTSKPNQLTVSGDASAIAEGYFKEGANKNDVIFLEDKEALDNVGLKEEKFSRPDIPPYANLTDDAGIAAAMSDWSNGLPVGIEKIDGAETVSQEGSDLFVKHGTNSAKVECNAEQGLQTIDIDLKPEDLNPYFSTTVYLQVETGGVRIELIDADGKTHPTDQLAETNVNETRAIKIGGAEPAAGPAKIKIIAQSDNTVFYLDAITLTQSSYALPYAPLMGPKALWIEAGKHLKKYGGDRPDVWNGQVMDDAYFGSGSKEIEIGSFVKVQEDWNEGTQSYDSEFTVRVVELSYSEDRNNGRYKKTVRLADKNTQASRFFQEQYLTTESQQQSLGVRDVPNKPIIDRDNAVIEGGTPRFEQVEIYPDTGKPPLVLGSNAQGELVTGFNADLLGGYHAADFIREDIENTFSAKQTFNDEARFNSFARFKTDGRIQGDGGGAVEVLANDGTNTGILRVDKIIVNNLEVAEDIDQTNTNELRVEDQYIVVNEGQTGTPSLDGGLYAERGDQSDAYLYFDEGNDDWGKKFGSAGTFDKAIFKSDIFPNDSIQGLGASDSPTWAGATFTGFVEITTGGNQNLNQRRTNWDAGDYFGTHVSGQPTNAILQHRFWDESVSSYINIVDFKRNGDADFYGDVTTEMLYTTSSEGGFYIKDSRSTPKWFADFLLKTTSNGIPYLSIDTDKTERIKIDHNSGIVNIIEGIDIAGNPFVDSALALTAGTGDFSDDLYTAGALTVDLDASLKDDVFTHATIGSPDFASKTTDWQITKAGHGDFRSIYSDEIRTEAFIAEISEALAGADFLTKSRGVLSRNFQVPSNGNTGTLYVEDLEGFQNSRVFSAGNTIRLRVIDKSGGGLVVANIWGTVSNYSDLSGGEQSWTFTTTDDGGSAGGTIYAGSVALDYGVSGDGYIERTTLDQSGSPYSQTVTWEDTTGNNIPDSYTVLTRIGVLDGLAGLSGAGMYAKDNVYFEFGSGDLFIVGKNAGGTGKHGVHIDSNNYHYGTGEWKVGDGTYYLQKKADGSLDSQLQSYHWDAQDLSIDSTYGIEVANTHELLNDGTFDFAGGILTGTTTSITGAGWDWTSSSLKKGTDIVLDATNKRITLAEGTTDEMSFGYGVGGTGLHGMHLDSNNYWYSGKDFKVHVDSNNFISVLQGSGVNVKATQFLLDSSNVQIGDTSGWLGASNILSYSSNSVGFAGFTADSNKISANTGSDFWDGANNEFQFGGTDGISFPVNGNVKVGSGVDIFGNLDVSTLPRINDDGLVGLWRFDEGDGTTVINSTGNKNGTINGATDAKGISGRSLDFDGTNDYVSIPNYSQLNNISFTISAWIYPTASTGDHVIFYKIDGGNSGYGLRLQGLTPQFFVMDSGSSLISSTEDVTVNKWNHIIATYDGSNTEIFVNAKSTATGTGTITTNAIDASIGARNDSLSQYFEGRIDEVRFYNRAIDLSEVKSLYANPSGTSGGLISANQLRTGRIESTNLSYTGGTYTADGMLIDLDAGDIIAEEFSIINGNASFKGVLEAPSGDIGGFQVGGSVIESFGDGQSFVKMISGTRPEFRFQAQNGELLHIGGDYSFDQEDDTAYGGSGIAEFNALVSVIGENNDTTTETRSSTQNINASDIGKSLDYVATYDVNLDENGTASASAKITITIQFRDSNNTVLSSASNSDTRTSDGFGFTTGTSGQVPTNTDHVNVIVELQADATSFDKDGSAQAEITFKSDDINAIGVNEFISPLGFSFVNEGSTASRKPRILGDRDIGQLLCHEFVVENQDGDQFTLKVTTGSNPQLKIYDENGGEVQAFG